jgi:hypothetical protein
VFREALLHQQLVQRQIRRILLQHPLWAVSAQALLHPVYSVMVSDEIGQDDEWDEANEDSDNDKNGVKCDLHRNGTKVRREDTLFCAGLGARSRLYAPWLFWQYNFVCVQHTDEIRRAFGGELEGISGRILECLKVLGSHDGPITDPSQNLHNPLDVVPS